MLFWILLAGVAIGATVRTVVLVRSDGLGTRPAPRSHDSESVGSTWPHHGDQLR